MIYYAATAAGPEASARSRHMHPDGGAIEQRVVAYGNPFG